MYLCAVRLHNHDGFMNSVSNPERDARVPIRIERCTTLMAPALEVDTHHFDAAYDRNSSRTSPVA